MTSPITAHEDASGWVLRFADGRITQLRVDHRLTLVLIDDVDIVLESACTLTGVDGVSVRVPPGEQSREVAAALPLFDQVVTRVVVARSGALRVEVDGGAVVTVEPDPQWESWQLVDPTGPVWVGLPGGGVQVVGPGIEGSGS